MIVIGGCGHANIIGRHRYTGGYVYDTLITKKEKRKWRSIWIRVLVIFSDFFEYFCSSETTVIAEAANPQMASDDEEVFQEGSVHFKYFKHDDEK